MGGDRAGLGYAERPSRPDTLFIGANRACSLIGGMDRKIAMVRLLGGLCRLQATAGVFNGSLLTHIF
jgi:hypothetical protein